MRNHLIRTGIIAAILMASACTGAKVEVASDDPWTLAADQSGMTYVTVKNNEIGEINTFREIAGSVTPDGTAQFTVNLDSVDTNNETRDPRMREHVFKTAEFPTATVTTQVDMAQFENLAVGSSETVLLDVAIDLAGVRAEESYYVLVTRLGTNKVVVANKAPFMLDADMFDMGEGIETLRGLAGLDSISPVVPVTVSLVFER